MSLLTRLIEPVSNIVGKFVKDKDLAQQLEAELTKEVLTFHETELKEAASVIRTEAGSQSWLARNWRPGLMALFGLIIANNYVLYPYLSLFFPEAPMLEIPPDMWGLLKIGIGGYIVGRSTEKGIKVWRGKE